MKNWFGTMAWLLLVSCGPAAEAELSGQDTLRGSASASLNPVVGVLEREMARIDAEVARIDSIFQPLPLLRPAQEQALRRFNNAQHLVRARALGIGPSLGPERLAALQREGALVRLEDGEHWVIRELEYSQPLAVPGVRSLLAQIGRRFHTRLREIGVPAFRLEVTSLLRTAQDQAALRRTNPNAALGETTHEYGTSVDILYSAFSAPARPVVDVDVGEDDWLVPQLNRYATVAAERVAARRALEIKAILGEVLIELQNEGAVLVTVERLQPVFHMTVARAQMAD